MSALQEDSPASLEAGQTSDNAKDPELKTWQRYLVLFIVSWNCLVVTSTSTSLLVATPEIAKTFGTTAEILNGTNAAVLIAMGCSSLLWSPLSDVLSRRFSYNAAIVVLFLTSVGTAVSPNMAAFTAMRILTGLTGTYFMVAGQTFIADIFVPVVRGRAVGCLMVGSVAGTAVGPCIAGIIVTYNTWRTIYWLQVGQAGLGLILSLLFIPGIKSEVRQLSEKIDGEKLSARDVLQRFNPVKVFKLFFRRQVLLADLACGMLAITQYALLSSIRHTINPRFHFTTGLVSGLFYISPGVGFIAGSLIGGRFSDRTVKRWIVKRDGLRLPKDRLNSGFVYLFFILPLSTLLYGWGLDKKFGGLPLAIVMAFWIGVGLMGAYNGLNTYTAEVFPDQRSEVVSSKYVMQYCFGAATSGAIVPLINAAGIGWAFTILTFTSLLGGLIVLYVARLNPSS